MKCSFCSKWFLLPILLAAAFGCGDAPVGTPASSKSRHPLLGAWEMTEVHWISADTTYSIPKSQPGLLIVNEQRYSLMWTRTQQPRTPFKVLSRPTDDELKAGFQSVVFNGGTYRLDKDLVTTAQIAKVPGFEGGDQYYRYSVRGDTLELTMYDETYPDGTKPEWAGIWETRLVFHRAR